MSLAIKHKFNNPKSNSADPTIVRPTNWNDTHTMTMAAGKVLGRDNSGDGDAQELPLSFDVNGNPSFATAGVPPVGYDMGAAGLTADRPAVGGNGMRRTNTELGAFEVFYASDWHQLLTADLSLAINENADTFGVAPVMNIGAALGNYLELHDGGARQIAMDMPQAAVDLSIASPCVVTWPGHAFVNGQGVVFATSGALPTGLTAGTMYYIVGVAGGTFQVSATVGGAAINTSGTQSGTQVVTASAIVTWLAHGLSNGALVILNTEGVLYTGLAAGTIYFVVNAATNTFQLAATSGGVPIATSGAQSGRHIAAVPVTVTISIATPGVVTKTAHGLPNGTGVSFSTTGGLPTGVTAGTVYYVVNTAANTFNLASVPGGTALNTSGSQSGTHSMNASNAPITAFDTVQRGAVRTLEFGGAGIIKHNAVSLINFGAANLIAMPGDVFEFTSLGAGNWRMTRGVRANGSALVQYVTPQRKFVNLMQGVKPQATTTPFDGTIPQITEGNDFFGSMVFARKISTSRVRLTVTINFAAGSTDVMQIALFEDGGANAIAVFPCRSTDSALPQLLTMVFDLLPSAGSHTYNIRVGANGAGIYINGTSTSNTGLVTSLVYFDELPV